MAASAKLIAEAGAEEVKVILGSICDFRSLSIAIPENNVFAWRKAILDILKANCTSYKELGRVIGRCIHLGLPFSQVHHFMNRWRGLLKKAMNRRVINLTDMVVEDLKLMLFFLDEAKKGVDMNLLVYRKPTEIYRSDSCPAGLGGYSSDGFAWRFYIPSELKYRASNNLLKHLATIITHWVDIINKLC